jgi:hypothetical protein
MIELRLWQGVLVQHSVKGMDGRAFGLIQVTEPDFENEYANLNLIVEPGAGRALAGPVREVVERTFRSFPLRKLCISYAADQATIEGTLEGVAAIEGGRLTDHERCGPDQYIDVIIAEIWRSDAP